MRLRNLRRTARTQIPPETASFAALRSGSATNWFIDVWEAETSDPTATHQIGLGINTASAVMARNPNNGRIVVCGQTVPYYSDDGGVSFTAGTYTAAVGTFTFPAAKVEYYDGVGFFFTNGQSGAGTRTLYSKDGIRWNRLLNVPNSAAMFALTADRFCVFGYNAGVFASALLSDISTAWDAALATANLTVAFTSVTADYSYANAATFGARASAVGIRSTTTRPVFTRTVNGLTLVNQTLGGTETALTLRGYVWAPELNCIVGINTSNGTVRLKTFMGGLDDAFEDTVSVPGNNLSFVPQAIAKSGSKYAVVGVSRIAFGTGANDAGQLKRFTFTNLTNSLAGNYFSAVSLT